jgi:hypothetical protein
MSGILSAFMAEIILITYRGAKAGKLTKDLPVGHLPVPADYVGAMIIFGLLSALPGELKRPAGVMGWGIVVATALNVLPASIGGPKTTAATVQPKAAPKTAAKA